MLISIISVVGCKAQNKNTLKSKWTNAVAVEGVDKNGNRLYYVEATQKIKNDTIPILMLVCDTSGFSAIFWEVDKNTRVVKEVKKDNVWWMFGYEVREHRSKSDFQVCDWENAGRNYCIRQRLDENKKPLSKSTVVWVSKNR